MKSCPNCKINIGGTFEECPLCQGRLLGDATIDYFPKSANVKQRPLWQNIIIFIMLSAVVVTLSLDFLFLDGPHIHFGLIVTIWVLILFFINRRFMNNHRIISRMITLCMMAASVGAILTEYVAGYKGVTTHYVIPGFISAALIANFILSFIDRTDSYNATFYILWTILLGVIPCIVIIISKNHTSIGWEICFFTSVLVFVGLIVFKGRDVLAEIHKRLHF
ncbi:MAG: hypothetical protein K6B28_08360 [Lachnospiraceae bacterium]|nr:hypothetical protein [Lachnospiraceae bacterium]